MNNKTMLFGVATLLILATLPQLTAATIDLPLYGFQIDPLDAPAGPAPTTALMLFLPATEEFAPNINVQVQPYTETIKDYVALSKQQFEQLKWKIVSDKLIGDNEWSVEYTGQEEGSDLHFYARAVSKSGKVYLATGTAKESQWATVGETLRQHVDSLKVD
jgi:hypothetical protein